MTGRRLDMRPKRRTITFPAEITKRGNTHYVTILKSYMEMLGISEGDIVDVTIRRSDESIESGEIRIE